MIFRAHCRGPAVYNGIDKCICADIGADLRAGYKQRIPGVSFFFGAPAAAVFNIEEIRAMLDRFTRTADQTGQIKEKSCCILS